MGCERRVFILSATFGAATFNVLNSLPAGLLLFVTGYLIGWLGTCRDPHMLQITKAAMNSKPRYDPAKRPAAEAEIEITRTTPSTS